MNGIKELIEVLEEGNPYHKGKGPGGGQFTGPGIPTIDHSILSPSGSVSKSTQKKAIDKVAKTLFPEGIWDKPKPTASQANANEVAKLRRQAAELRGLAQRGMNPRSYAKKADKLDKDADALEKG